MQIKKRNVNELAKHKYKGKNRGLALNIQVLREIGLNFDLDMATRVLRLAHQVRNAVTFFNANDHITHEVIANQ